MFESVKDDIEESEKRATKFSSRRRRGRRVYIIGEFSSSSSNPFRGPKAALLGLNAIDVFKVELRENDTTLLLLRDYF